MSDSVQEIVSFTNVDHIARKELYLSVEEYCTADLIDKLSHNPKSAVTGWCYASKPTMAQMLDTSRASIFRYIEKLLEEGLIEKNTEQPNLLRTTSKWYETVEVRKSRLIDKKHPSQNETGSIKRIPHPSQNETVDPSQNETLQEYINKDNDNTNAKALAVPAKVDQRNPDISDGIEVLGQLLNHKVQKETYNRYSLKRLYKSHGKEKTLKAIEYSFTIQSEDRYAPRIFNYMDLEDKWDQLVSYGRKKISQPKAMKASDIARMMKGDQINVVSDT